VQRASDFQPDFITMDIRMPGMAGFDAARVLHRVCATAKIIIVTSYDQPDFRRAAAHAGVAGYVIKENLSDLPQVIDSLDSRGEPDGQDCGGEGI
jgi:DNA-binding NarL/FixJ family response regulator